MMSEVTVTRYKLAKDIFEHILRVTEHEDQKAGRIIISIAFLSTTSATIYGIFINNGITFIINNIDVIPIFFLLIMACSILGAILMLIGIGPNIEDVEPNPLVGEDYIPQSLYYFKKIALEDNENWRNYFFKNEIEDILKKGSSDYLQESHVVSNRICFKIKYIGYSKTFFILSIILTLIMTFLGIIN